MDHSIRKLNYADLSDIENLSSQKLNATNTDRAIFEMPGNDAVYRYFVLPDNVYGADTNCCFGYFQGTVLVAVLGIRCIRTEPSWILSWLFTSVDCENPRLAIKSLLEHVIEYQENRGYFQWYVISKLEKFRAWQKLFGDARRKYHHYVYARTKANQIPKWPAILSMCGNKLFPYDTNISMYVSKSLCTTDDDGNTQEIDENLLQ